MKIGITKTVVMVFLTFGLMVMAYQKEESGQYENISPAAFNKIIHAEKGLILDVRTPEEVAEGFIAGALNLNFFEESFKNELGKLAKDQPVYVYCRSGGRSGKTMAQMKDLGFKQVYNLDGGILAWKKEGLPLEKPETP